MINKSNRIKIKEFRYSDLSEKKKYILALAGLALYLNEFVSKNHICWLEPEEEALIRCNKAFSKILYLLKKLNIFNKTIRHVDWKHSDRYAGAMAKVGRNVQKFFTGNTAYIHIKIKN